VIRGEGRDITVSSLELCQYIATTEDKIRRQRALVRHTIFPGVKKRKISETPPERIACDDEAKYAEQDERAAKRTADHDPDYEDASGRGSLSN
jgi:hypothetical protein